MATPTVRKDTLYKIIDRDQSSTYTLPMIVRLEIALRQAEHYMVVAKRNDNGDMWAKGWYRALDLCEQIAMLSSLTGAIA